MDTGRMWRDCDGSAMGIESRGARVIMSGGIL